MSRPVSDFEAIGRVVAIVAVLAILAWLAVMHPLPWSPMGEAQEKERSPGPGFSQTEEPPAVTT